MSILVISFDGLDKDLIEEYKLENIIQEEFGTIDNDTDIKVKVTSELFASFITGETWESHGVIGLNRYVSDKVQKIESFNKFSSFRKFSGLRKKLYKELPFVNSEMRNVNKEDLPLPTIFDKISKSKAIGVRSYSKGYNDGIVKTLEHSGVKEAEEELDRNTEMKKRELYESLSRDYQLIMAHFHKPDYIHHWYWEVDKMDKVEETYREIDEFAGEILEKAEENDFDTVIFMSDHGLPDVENGGHNENAFYSCNHELFGDETPHITDFHDKILSNIDSVDLEEVDF
ncbi:MAG: alkaline phosphatase family protein [Candidatus Nanohalobium sp.]